MLKKVFKSLKVTIDQINTQIFVMEIFLFEYMI